MNTMEIQRAAPRTARQYFGTSRSARGFSLIELMVGLLISLIGTFAMLKAFASFEGQKRSTTSGNDAQQAGSFSLYEMERQVRTAGSAIVQGKSAKYNIWACAVQAKSAGATVLPLAAAPSPEFSAVGSPTPGAFPASQVSLPLTARAIPALIYSGGATGSDVVSIVSGDPAVRTFGAGIFSASATVAKLGDSAFGVYGGEYVLASNLSAGGVCSVGKIAAVNDPSPPPVPPAPPTNTLTFDAANTTGMLNQTYLFDLGTSPVFSLFGVNPTKQTLVQYDLLQRSRPASSAAEIADGIVAMKAIYGVDDGAAGGTANDGIIDEWVLPTTGGTWGADTLTQPANYARISQIRAVRIAVVARSQLNERASDYTGSAAGIVLFPDLAAGLRFTIPTATQYRYQVYDTKIPLRNAAVNRIY